MTDDERFPTEGVYRGVRLNAFQGPARLVIVKVAIDAVHDLADPLALFEYAGDVTNPPEARLFARAKVEAAFEIAAETRWSRPPVDLNLLRARTAGLASRRWADPYFYASRLDQPRPPGVPNRAIPREVPLPDRYAPAGKAARRL